MDLENNGKINFLIAIHTPFSHALTGGIVAMHKLAYELADRGHNVYTFCEPEYPHKNIRVIPSTIKRQEGFVEWYDWEPFFYNLSNTVSIYPQIARGNPFNTQHVVRWVLYDTEPDIENAYGPNDVYFNYGNFKTFKDVEYRPLTVFNYNFDKLYQTNYGKRKGFCHIIHKHTPPDGLEVFQNINSIDLTNWKTKGAYDYLREQLNQYEYFLTYDQKSFYTLAAGLCGTKSIILNPGQQYEFAGNALTMDEEYDNILTPTEYRLKNPIQMFGTAYGWEDIQWANNTIGMVRDHLMELDKIDKKTIDGFVRYWENKILK
jgi:hypothetical protein